MFNIDPLSVVSVMAIATGIRTYYKATNNDDLEGCNGDDCRGSE